LAEGWR